MPATSAATDGPTCSNVSAPPPSSSSRRAFERLPLRDKDLAWHLYEAALAGRDIYYDQRYDTAW